MAKYFGKVGFVTQEKTKPGVTSEVRREREYCGDILKNSRRYENGAHLNDDINVNNRISIVADAYAADNFFALRYLYWMGATWEVTNVEVSYPRLILTIGGVYNGQTGPTPSNP